MGRGPVPSEEHAVGDEHDEGGEAACWAHLLGEDGRLDPTAHEAVEGPCTDDGPQRADG